MTVIEEAMTLAGQRRRATAPNIGFPLRPLRGLVLRDSLRPPGRGLRPSGSLGTPDAMAHA
jgi:hypothetical protein